MRMRLPPPGAPVDCEICAPATLPWNAFSIDWVVTFVISSALTLATDVARLRREMPVACPVITTWSSFNGSRFSTMSTELVTVGMATSVCGYPMRRTVSTTGPDGTCRVKVPFSRVRPATFETLHE
jgi:hypothetical protein